MEKRKQLIALILLNCLSCSGTLAASPAASDPVDNDKDIVSTKHYHFPFVHVDVGRHKDGSKDYDVKAPFTKVHNPAGPDNAQVKAPFTKVNNTPNNTANNAKAPQTSQQKSVDQKKQQQK